MTCERCSADMLPHVDIKGETTFICPICGNFVIGLEGYPLEEEMRQYWLDRTALWN
jgi:hypothetical protein